MTSDIDITSTATLPDIEEAILKLQSGKVGSDRSFKARITSKRRSSYFLDIWSAIAIGSVPTSISSQVKAWGLQDWSNIDDEDGFALSYPGLAALQLGAQLICDGKEPQLVDAAQIRRHLNLAGGILGSTGARHRTIVELDPDLPQATPLIDGFGGRDAFFEFVHGILRVLEIGAMATKTRNFKHSADKGTILEFLYELQANAKEHGHAKPNIRFLRLQKHLYPNRTKALTHATGFTELSRYLLNQPEKPSNRKFNLVEASVSDFGPGILDGFLATSAGAAHTHRPRLELLTELIHRQLSSKSDPNAGLGIRQALRAARQMGAFVSLRTAEFWYVLQPSQSEEPHLVPINNKLAKIRGTHWQLLLPDPTV